MWVIHTFSDVLMCWEWGRLQTRRKPLLLFIYLLKHLFFARSGVTATDGTTASKPRTTSSRWKATYTWQPVEVLWTSYCMTAWPGTSWTGFDSPMSQTKPSLPRWITILTLQSPAPTLVRKYLLISWETKRHATIMQETVMPTRLTVNTVMKERGK